MWVLTPQSLDTVRDDLRRALTLSNGESVYAPSAAEYHAIEVVYRLYEALGGQPNAALRPAALDAARPSLYTAYNQVQIGGRLADLRERLLSSTDSCPYCGFGEPTDLDHYLPRVVYGELSIYPNNLVPSCGKCNNAKRAIVPGVGPGPGLIHPYFQELPDADFLSASITFHDGSIDVSFFIDHETITAVLAEKLQFQLERLRLNERYPAQINKFLNEQRESILMLREISEDLVASWLRRNAVSLADNFHRNDWRVALMRALSEVPDFCSAPAAYLGAEVEAA
ncbi:HNH endonuclease [Rhodovulum visakhapatnamense]|uniref:HNH endonuclease n=1 Tax=Rhodovulum visakhapatnamense TaxID=364297 RepID=A0ABS1RJY7_9RHOB|nr:HNH endonuclease [Rhodovulum visakhapatnamense]MBL3571570.1 HNH endonuclease [Rhodovulum visakhapatnamense]MBL3579555.1 HNH endonuclease [Rhodovulum visakhapatnamense]